MKKIFLAVLCCLLGATATWADEEKNVSLSGDHKSEVLNLGFCNILVTLVNAEADEPTAKVLVEIENLGETNQLVIFDRAYDAKALKKLPKKMKFGFNERVISPFSYAPTDGSGKQMLLINPSEKRSLPTVMVGEDGAECTLPIYTGKMMKQGFFIFGSKNLVLLDRYTLKLNITAEMKPSQEFLNLQSAYQSLKNDLSSTTFCNNRSHRQSLEAQKAPFKQRLDDLTAKLDAAISSHGGADAAAARRYVALKNDVTNNIVLDNHVGDCGRHSVPVPSAHQCSYCSWTLQQIYQEMDRIYRAIYNSSDRQAAKASNMSKVNALYQCCTDAKCTRHKNEWSRGGTTKNNIVRCYNRIQGL